MHRNDHHDQIRFPHRRRERKLQCNDELSYQVLLPPGYLRNYSQDEGRRLILTHSVHRAKFPLPSSRIIFLSFATPRSDGMLIIVFNSLLSLLIWLLSFLLSKRIFVPTMWFTVLNENASVAWLYSNIHIIVGNEKQEKKQTNKKNMIIMVIVLLWNWHEHVSCVSIWLRSNYKTILLLGRKWDRMNEDMQMRVFLNCNKYCS